MVPLPEARWGGLRILVQLRLSPLRRAFKGLDSSGVLRLAVFLGLGLGFEALLFGVFRALAVGLWSQPLLGPLLGARVLGLGLDLLFALILLTSLPAFLGSLLQGGGEADFFISSPLPPRAFFSLRLAEAALGVAWVLPLLWVPALLALRRALGAGLCFTLWGLLAPLPLAALGLVLGASLLCLLLKFLPPARLRVGLRIAAGLGFAVFMLALCLSHPERLSDPQHARSVEDYLAGLQALDSPWWPGTWAARAVLWQGTAPLKALGCFLILALPALACGLGLVQVFGADAFEWWQKGQQGASSRGRGGRGAFRYERLRAPWRVLLEHAWVALRRAPGQVAQALLLIGLLALFTVSLGRLPLGTDQQLKDWLFLPVCCVAQALLVAVAARFVYPAASLDHGARALLRQAPAGAKAHLGSQVVLGVCLLLPLGLFLAWSVDRALSPPGLLALASWVSFSGLALSLAWMQAGLGQAWARPVGHAEEALGSAPGVLAVVLGLLLVLGGNALLAPLLRYEYIGRFVVGRSRVLPALGLVLALGLDLGAAVFGWNLGIKRMEEGA